MITIARQPEVLAQIESRYQELLEGLTELEARVAATLEVVLRRKSTSQPEGNGKANDSSATEWPVPSSAGQRGHAQLTIQTASPSGQ